MCHEWRRGWRCRILHAFVREMGGEVGAAPGILDFGTRLGRTSYVVSELLGWYIFLLPSSSLPRRLGLGLCTIKEGKGKGKNESV